MNKEIEVPDIELKEEHGDTLDIYINKDKICFQAGVDNCGAYFEINKDKFKEVIKLFEEKK